MDANPFWPSLGLKSEGYKMELSSSKGMVGIVSFLEHVV